MWLWLHRRRKCETWKRALNQADDQKVKPLALTNKPIDKRRQVVIELHVVCGILPRITSIYVECSGIFPRLRTRCNKPIEKWTKRNLPHTLVYIISNSPTCRYINMYERWIYFKGEKGLCTQRCATVYRQELPPKKDQKKLIVPNCYIIPVIVSALEQTRPRARELADWKESMSAGLPSSGPTTSFKI